MIEIRLYSLFFFLFLFMDIRCVNSLVLAYLGDAVYEEYIRDFLIKKKINKVNDLQKESINYVSAKRQAYFLDKMLDSDFFNEDEISVIKRARNAKSHANPKGCSVIEYKKATAIEALIGYLKLSNRMDRIDEVMNYIVEELC